MPFDINLSEFRSADIFERCRQIEDAGLSANEKAAGVKALNAKFGYDEGGPFSLDENGKVQINNKSFDFGDISRDNLNTALNDFVTSPEQLSNIQNALNDTSRGNPTEAQVQEAQQRGSTASPPQVQALEQRFNEMAKSINDKWDPSKPDKVVAEQALGMLRDELNKSNKGIWGTVLKYTLIGALTFAGLQALSNAQTACYAEYNQQKNKVDPNVTKAADCVLFAPTGTSGANAFTDVWNGCATQCTTLISGSTVPPKTTTDFSTLSAASCNCTANGQIVSPNVSLVYESVSVWQVFGNIINSIGGFIGGLINNALKLMSTLGDILNNLGTILMWAGIGAAIIGLIVGLVYLGKKMHDKKKAKQLQQGGIKGGRKWHRTMKKLRNTTPLSHLTYSHALL